MTAPRYFIGLMSGTSADGIDAALVRVGDDGDLSLLEVCESRYPETLRHAIFSLQREANCHLNDLAATNVEVAECFAGAVHQLLEKADANVETISAIGSHGQTLLHQPNAEKPFSLQIGNPNVIAEMTGITVVADFRGRDIAAGGQGAPLTPLFHRAMIEQAAGNTDIDQLGVINIGGIANISLFTEATTFGFDIGPGNTLIDEWSREHIGQPYDTNGDWARTGDIDSTLLQWLLADPYFQLATPKSTGQDYFNREWLQSALRTDATPETVQRTLLELTALTTANAIRDAKITETYLCGGGVHNSLLRERITAAAPQCNIMDTNALGLSPDWIEAAAFAWFAANAIDGIALDTRSVTGALSTSILGAIYPS